MCVWFYCGFLTCVRGPPGVTGALLLALICFIAVLLWCLSRHKGSYVTNELDDDDVDDDEEESVASDTALQSKEPLKIKGYFIKTEGK
uniref:Uncharacterized protein n=1 Tax=Sphaeramia orbicularis TaxID=375764 RepID=A0A673AJX4_9TELE